MKKAALFFALSLSIFSFGCGTEQDGVSSSDGGGMTGKMDDPFSELSKTYQYPNAPEGPLLMKTTVCKTDVYFYESKDGKSINWFGFWNRNDVIVHAYVYETNITASIAYPILQPNAKGGSDWDYSIDRGHAVSVYIEKLDSTGRNLLPCETVHATMP